MASVPVEVLHNWVLTISEAKSVLCFSATACYLPRPRSHPNSAMAPYRFVFLSFCPTLLHELSRSSLLTLTPIPFFLFSLPLRHHLLLFAIPQRLVFCSRLP
jgi:hypothetical protein